MADSEQVKDTLRDDLVAAFSASEAPATPETAPVESAPAEVAPSAEPELAPSSEGERRDGERPRGPDGKFIPKAAAETPAKAETTTEPFKGDQPKDTTTEAAKPIGPPESWSPADKAKWDALPPDIKAVIAKRESDFQAGLGKQGKELHEAKSRYQDLDRILEPYRDKFVMAGVTPAQAVHQLLLAHQRLETDGAEAIKWLAKSYGVDLAQLVGGQSAEPEFIDPQIKQLTEGQKRIENWVRQQQTEMQETMRRALEADIMAFAKTAPHFDAVKADMIPLVAAVRAQNPELSRTEMLQQAYERAVWANPATRQKAMEERDVKARAEAKAKADAAARAAVSVNGAPGGSASTNAPAGSLRDELNRAFETVGRL